MQGSVGVFALQGDVSDHRGALARLGVSSHEVRTVADLERPDLVGLVLPGGESTTMLKLLRTTGLEQSLRRFLEARRVPVLATCAGTILLAERVTTPAQDSFGLLGIEVARNGYGRQVHSGTFDLTWVDDQVEGEDRTGVFIRAPRIVRTNPGVRVMARRGEDPVLIEQDGIIGCCFHPELVAGHPVTRLFVERVRQRGSSTGSSHRAATGGSREEGAELATRSVRCT